MSRCIVNVATGNYIVGQQRLRACLEAVGERASFMTWENKLPLGCPPHHDIPYAFKAYALAHAIESGYDTLLWLDACIVPTRELNELWERIERDGYWFSKNGYANGEWTCDAAYEFLGVDRDLNFQIPHVVATAFGADGRHATGRAFLDEYTRLAKTRAFCGPWGNENGQASADPRVKGHRHDQTAASVIAYRLGMELTDPPAIFAYKGGETDATLLVADGAY